MAQYISNIAEDVISDKVANASLDDPSLQELTFTMDSVDVSVANSIRRVILSEIPTLVLDSSEKEHVEDENIAIYKNNTILNNEIIKQRLSCIPVHEPDLNSFAYNNYKIEIDVHNDTLEKKPVTTEHIKIKNINTDEYLDEKTTRRMFPKCQLTDQFIDIVYLEPMYDKQMMEHLHLECGFAVGTAMENGCYNVASTCTYMNTKDEQMIEAKWKEMEAKMVNDDEETKLIKRKDFLNLDAERIFKPNSYDFKIQSVGVYKNRDLVKIACDVMIQKMKNFINLISSNPEFIKENNAFMDNCYDIEMHDEDFTLGKVMENITYIKCFANEKSINYVSCYKTHPHETNIFLRIAFPSETDKSNVVKMLEGVVNDCTIVYDTIKSAM